MTEREQEILEIIRQNPTIEQSEIARQLNIARGTVAAHIHSLQQQGYLLGRGYILNRENYIVGIGASNVDIYGRSRIAIREHYDHPADISSSIGGVMRNVICNYTRLGGEARFITAYSDDSYGQMIVENCRMLNIDIADSLYVPDTSSGIFIQIQDENNDMYLAICDMSILERIAPEYIRAKANIITKAAKVIIDPSLKDETIEEIIRICKDKVGIYIDPISDNFALKIRKYVGDFELIKPNVSELANLTDMEINSKDDLVRAGRKLLAQGLKKLVVSRGREGLMYMDQERTIFARLKEDEKMVNASGAGDAMMAAIIYGEVNGLSIEETIDYGLAAGTAAIRSEATVNDNMSIDLLEEIIKEKK